MNEIDGITLDGKEFAIIKEIIINGTKYVHLANVEDPKDFCIRKIVIKDEREYLTYLDNEEEFNFVLKELNKKYFEN